MYQDSDKWKVKSQKVYTVLLKQNGIPTIINYSIYLYLLLVRTVRKKMSCSNHHEYDTNIRL